MKPKKNRYVTKSRGKKVEQTDADLHAIDIRPYPFLPLPYICALRDIKWTTYKDRFTDLRNELGLVDCPDGSHRHAKAFYLPFSYELTAKGYRRVLKKFGPKPRYHRLANFQHDIITTLFVASLELGAREQCIPFATWDTIKQHKSCKLEDYRGLIEPDWSPVGIGNDPHFFLIEADHNTESFKSDAAYSLQGKFKGFSDFFDTKQHIKASMHKCFAVFLFIDHDRMYHAMDLLKELEPLGKENFLFATFKDFTQYEYYPKPNGWALEINFKRVGHPDFNILKAVEGGEAIGRAKTRTHSRAEATA